jgi:hypothetical protein
VKQSLDEYGDRLPAEDREEARRLVDTTLRWVESNQTAEKAEFEDQLQEAQKVCSRVLAKLHQQQSSGPTPPGAQAQAGCGQQYGGAQYGGGDDGPRVTEVD